MLQVSLMGVPAAPVAPDAVTDQRLSGTYARACRAGTTARAAAASNAADRK